MIFFCVLWGFGAINSVYWRSCLSKNSSSFEKVEACEKSILFGKIFEFGADRTQSALKYLELGVAYTDNGNTQAASVAFGQAIERVGLTRARSASNLTKLEKINLKKLILRIRELDENSTARLAFESQIENSLKNIEIEKQG